MGRIQGDLPERTFRFALVVLRLTDELPQSTNGWQVGKQLVRSGTGIGANVREADQAITDAEFANKCSIARKEAAETKYWLELCQASMLLDGDAVRPAMAEADQLTRILGAIVRGTQQHIAAEQGERRPVR